MMIQLDKEMVELYKKLMKTKDKEEIKKIRTRLDKLNEEMEEKLKDWPFVH